MRMPHHPILFPVTFWNKFVFGIFNWQIKMDIFVLAWWWKGGLAWRDWWQGPCSNVSHIIIVIQSKLRAWSHRLLPVEVYCSCATPCASTSSAHYGCESEQGGQSKGVRTDSIYRLQGKTQSINVGQFIPSEIFLVSSAQKGPFLWAKDK